MVWHLFVAAQVAMKIITSKVPNPIIACHITQVSWDSELVVQRYAHASVASGGQSCFAAHLVQLRLCHLHSLPEVACPNS
jgi:hypothetical protein